MLRQAAPFDKPLVYESSPGQPFDSLVVFVAVAAIRVAEPQRRCHSLVAGAALVRADGLEVRQASVDLVQGRVDVGLVGDQVLGNLLHGGTRSENQPDKYECDGCERDDCNFSHFLFLLKNPRLFAGGRYATGRA